MFQIMAISTFVALQVTLYEFAPSMLTVLSTVSVAVLVQIVCMKALRIPVDVKSAVITSLSLCLLLKASALSFILFAAVLAILSKFTLRWGDSHIFNPANFAIAVMVLAFPQDVWVSPGQWGTSSLLALLIIGLAVTVLSRVKGRSDMALIFLSVWSAALLLRALWLGDPLSIPLHNLQNGALLIFAFFMISDPKTIPATRIGRFIFALFVTVIAFILMFVYQSREALFFALPLACLLRPVIDWLFAQDQPLYHWPLKGKL